MIASDNTTIISYLKRGGGTHSPSLCMSVWDILMWCQSRKISLKTRHIPGRFNVIADSLSRPNKISQTEWSICAMVLGLVFANWGKPMTDLFATRFNNKLPLFMSPVPDHRAWAVDALSVAWDNLFAYAFPPYKLIPQVLNKIRNANCVIILIAPLWPQRSCFNSLLELLTDKPLQEGSYNSGKGDNPPSQPRNPTPTRMQIIRESIRNNFLSLQPIASQVQKEILQIEYIPISGGNSPIGVVKGRLILSTP